MLYFYIIKNSTDLGFGITGDYESRAQDYVSHSGPNSGAHFPYIFTGHTPHIKKLENIIKNQWVDRTYITRDGWRTEWLKSDESLDQFVTDILDLIGERHLRIELHRKHYNFLIDR